MIAIPRIARGVAFPSGDRYATAGHESDPDHCRLRRIATGPSIIRARVSAHGSHTDRNARASEVDAARRGWRGDSMRNDENGSDDDDLRDESMPRCSRVASRKYSGLPGRDNLAFAGT